MLYRAQNKSISVLQVFIILCVFNNNVLIGKKAFNAGGCVDYDNFTGPIVGQLETMQKTIAICIVWVFEHNFFLCLIKILLKHLQPCRIKNRRPINNTIFNDNISSL